MKVNRSKKKLQIRERIKELGKSFDPNDLAAIIQYLQSELDDCTEKGYTHVALDFEFGTWEDETYDLVLNGVREETDAEYNKRMKNIAEEKQLEKVKKEEHVNYIQKEAKRLKLIS